MTRGVGAVPLPLPLLALLNGGRATFGRAAEHGEEDLHEGVVGIIIARPFAIDYTREGGLIRAFFEYLRHDQDLSIKRRVKTVKNCSKACLKKRLKDERYC